MTKIEAGSTPIRLPEDRDQMFNRATAFLTLILFCCSCATETHWIQDLELPAAQGSVADKKIIVSRFVSSDRIQTSVTSYGAMDSSLITEMTDSARIYDMAPELAAELRSRGFDAEARDDFGAEELVEGQVLLRGAILAHSLYRDWFPQWGLMTITLFAVGGILPSPIESNLGYHVKYRVEILDHDRRFVYSTPTGDAIVATRFHNYLQHYYSQEKAQEGASTEMRKRIVSAIADQLGQDQ